MTALELSFSVIAEVFVWFVLFFSPINSLVTSDNILVLSQLFCAGKSGWTCQSYKEHKNLDADSASRLELHFSLLQ